ncbi:MAG: hypothetical protein ACOZNI_12410 [Myxococcota bacterium]
MISQGSVGEDAGRLITCALTPRARPAAMPAYAELMRRYREDAAFRVLVDGVARGLGLQILDASEHGLVLGATADSVFGLKLADYRQTLTAEDRVVHGMIQLAIAAWCYPTAAALDDPEGVVVPVSVHEVVQYLREVCEQLARRAEQDPEIGTPELRDAWRAILERAETRGTPDHRRTAGTLNGMVEHALERLAERGLLRREGDANGGTWRALRAYRVQVRELGAHVAFQLVRQAGQGAK